MHGPGYPPPQQPHNNGSVITLRVIFSVLTVISCGFLAWAAMLRLAFVTRKKVDWLLFVACVLIFVFSIAYLGSLPDDASSTTGSNTTILILLLTAIAVLSYYLYAEITHFARQARLPGAYYPPTPPQFGYGYGAPPQTMTPMQPQPQAQTRPTHTPPPAQPPTPPITAPPTPTPAPAPRIDQVRAELDDLSDILRKQREEGR
jgi:hypothetical protein